MYLRLSAAKKRFHTSSPAVAGVDRIPPVGKDEEHVVRLGRRAFHPRRAARHACHSESACFRTLGEQSLDFPCRHVTFDRIALDDGGMATAQRVGYAVLRPILVSVAYVFRLRTEAVCPQMFDPRAAAASGRALVDGNCRFIRIFGRASWQQQRRTYNGRL